MYVVMIVVGLGFILISLFAGEFFEFEGAHISILRPSVIALALVVTGGVGILMTPQFSHFVALPVGLGIGMAVSLAVSKAILEPLHRSQNTSTVDSEELIGKHATVTSIIPQSGFGQITYEVNGSKVTGPAKGKDGRGVKQGEIVEILSIVNNTYFVKPITEHDKQYEQ
ncbi:MAG: hypothetical protein FWE92_01870 [Defluviitaleaceae bacterium]|nr:hypothetical protein [Defluviitaleaceae bacterium]